MHTMRRDRPKAIIRRQLYSIQYMKAIIRRQLYSIQYMKAIIRRQLYSIYEGHYTQAVIQYI